MSLLLRQTDLTPDVPRLARALSVAPGAQLLWSGGVEARSSYLCCDPVAYSAALDPEPGLPLRPELGPEAGCPRWVGALPYECRRGLERRSAGPDPRPAPHFVRPAWQRYAAVARVDAQGVTLVGESVAALDRLHARLREAQPAPRGAPETVRLERVSDSADTPRQHIERVQRALDLIARGELYQVNLARRFSYHVQGGAIQLLLALASHDSAPYASALNLGDQGVVGMSPELCLRVEPSGQLSTTPIKGTRPRGADATLDAQLALELDQDPKERAELAMILDVERNDLGRVAATGSVRLTGGPEVVSHPTIHHRQATLVAQLRPGVSRVALLEAMLPSGSVTGAPKIRAMDLIAELEPVRRGLYTGAYGYLSHAGGLELAMAIRSLSVKQGVGHYHTGGGIVADSDPGRELEETEWKAAQFEALARTSAKLR